MATPERAAARRPAARAGAAGRRGLSLATREALTAYLFILPSFLGFAAFLLIPMVMSAGISLYDWELLRPPRFIGLQNYRDLVADPLFRTVLFNTAYYAFGLVPLNIVVSLGLALWLNTKLRGLTFFRLAFFLPVVTVTVAVSLIWKWMYEPRLGIVNAALALFG